MSVRVQTAFSPGHLVCRWRTCIKHFKKIVSNSSLLLKALFPLVVGFFECSAVLLHISPVRLIGAFLKKTQSRFIHYTWLPNWVVWVSLGLPPRRGCPRPEASHVVIAAVLEANVSPLFFKCVSFVMSL